MVVFLILLIAILTFLLAPKKQVKHDKLNTSTVTPYTPPSPTPKLEIQFCSENECTIKELGIKFATPNGLHDLVYVADQNYAAFSTRSLMAKTGGCLPSEFPLGNLSKIYKSETSESSGPWWYRKSELQRLSEPWTESGSHTVNPPEAKELDSFYIVYQGPQSVCSPSSDAIDLQTSQVKVFKETVQNVELIK